MPTENLYNEDAEISVLGAMLMERDATSRAIELCKPDYFYFEKNEIIFLTIGKIYERGDALDVVTLSDQLKSENKLNDVGGMKYLANLVDAVPGTANLDGHIKILREKHIQRKLVKESRDIAHKAEKAEAGTVEKVVDEAESRIFSISEDYDRRGLKKASDLIVSTMDELEQRIEQDTDIIGVHTGIPSLDKNTGGLKDSNLVIVAGRPSMGKTALATNIAQDASLNHDIPVAFFSLEMSETEVMRRMISSHAQVDGMKLQNGDLNDRELDRITKSSKMIKDAPVYVDDTPGIGIMELKAKARRAKDEYDIGLVIVDYLQLMQGDRDSQRYREIGDISRGLKGVAKELGVPVICISQLSRAPENREDHTPRLADLRESGDIEQDADVVIFVYRREVYEGKVSDEGENLENRAQLIIGKQRNGPTGTIHVQFDKQFTRFREA